MKLIQFLKHKRSLARKVFGKKELEIIEKQLQGLSLTQSERNRLSRDIKVKMKFIKECSKFDEELELKKNQYNKDLVKDAVDIILKHPFANRIKTILLYGSMVSGNFSKRSDIDIAVVFKKDFNVREATLFRKEVMGEVADKIDIQVFNVLPLKVKLSIRKKYRILYKTKELNGSKIFLSTLDNLCRGTA